ncbi:hypothetical protein LSTR_LSTR003592 [Laodelphax striatellus]|uniref:Uncharacterized protein n=1 Tax=Laodelphax striatellus TaxID=195883 RepID=A0A482WLT8_LAOST|nr:hypothetical protein LSTR_LSTR003592 [Laodelphax striatellus]
MSDDTLRTSRPKRTPSAEKKMHGTTVKTMAVKEMFVSLSENLNEISNSVLVGADDSHLDIKESEMKFSSQRGRTGSFSDNDSPWQNGQFKSPKEIARYYSELGDWWNVLPKTDFTYYESSKWYRKEIAPGIPVIPNLARPPLHPVEKKSRFNLFSRSSGSTFETSSSNGKSQFTRFPILQQENKSFLSKLSDFFIDCLLGLLCLPYDLLFGNYWSWSSRTSSVTGRNSRNTSAWWTAPFRWTYQLMMLVFAWEIMILVSVRRFFKDLRLRTAFKLFLLLSIISSMVLAYGHYGVELSAIQMPSINISDLQNFTEWDYSGAIEMLKPLNISWAYDQYANLVNIGWVYE